MSPPRRNPNWRNSRRGVNRGNNIGGMVTAIFSDIIRLFLLLSPASRREILNYLTRLTEEAERQLPTAAPQQPTQRDSPKPATGGSPPEVQKPAHVAAWDRPIIRTLPYANRQQARSKKARDSPEGRSDSRLLSAALAAVNRSRKLGIPDQEVVAALTTAGEDIEVIRGLWLAQKVPAIMPETDPDTPHEDAKASNDNEEEVEPMVAEANPDPQLEERTEPMPIRPPEETKQKLRTRRSSPEDFAAASRPSQSFATTDTVTFVTDVTVPTTTVGGSPRLAEVPRDDLDPILGLNLASLHVPLHDLAIAFVNREQRNYSRLREYIRYRTTDGIIVLLRVPRKWGDQSDSDRENSPTPPAKRKRTSKKSKKKGA